MVFVCSTRTMERSLQPRPKIVSLSSFPDVTAAGSLLPGRPLSLQELLLYMETVGKKILRD